jgi:hypothetical protein
MRPEDTDVTGTQTHTLSRCAMDARLLAGTAVTVTGATLLAGPVVVLAYGLFTGISARVSGVSQAL